MGAALLQRAGLAARLATALPQARFVFLFRHPCDVFASIVRRARLELRDRIPIGWVSWLLLSADTFVQDWLSSLRAGRSFASRVPANQGVPL